ncbi:MAG: FmdB family zinc ribbon protein [Candidatus Omnitrophota bacterium]
MPTYEYECGKCEYRFDVFHSMSESPLTKCPKCNSKAKKLISSGSGIIFKGSGFYETDYKRAKDKPCENAGSSCPSACPKTKMHKN